MQSHWISIGTGIKGAGLKARHVPTMPRIPEFTARAVCPQTDPEIFYPEKGGSTREAKRVCRNECPVREECLEYALDNDERWGIWGGFSERERRAIKKRRAA